MPGITKAEREEREAPLHPERKTRVRRNKPPILVMKRHQISAPHTPGPKPGAVVVGPDDPRSSRIPVSYHEPGMTIGDDPRQPFSPQSSASSIVRSTVGIRVPVRVSNQTRIE